MTTFQRHEIDFEQDLVLQTIAVLLGFPAPRDNCGESLLLAVLPHLNPGKVPTIITTVLQRLRTAAVTPTDEEITGDRVAYRDMVIQNLERGGTVEIHEGIGATLHLNGGNDVVHCTVMALPGPGIEKRKAYLHSTITIGLRKVNELQQGAAVETESKPGAN